MLIFSNVNLFEARLDRFSMDQDVKYDFTADLTEYATDLLDRYFVTRLELVIDQ